MNDSVPVEDFSTLDNWLPAAPLWRPFRTEAPRSQLTSEFAEGASN